MKISKIVIDSLYGIKHLELDGSPIELTGPTGSGKTSVIDSIRYALTNSSERDYIVKKGEREGEVFVETDTGISIRRKKRTDKSDYSKITEFGKDIKSPQTFVNEIFTPLQLNPIEFATWDKNTQNRVILDLIEFDWDIDWIEKQFGEIPKSINYGQHILKVLDDIQAKNSDYWLRREVANRKELYKRQQISDINKTLPPAYDLTIWENYSLSEKIAQLEQIQLSNSRVEKAKGIIEQYENKVRGIEAEKKISLSAIEQEIASEKTGLSNTIERLKAEIIAAEDKLTTLSDKQNDKIKVVEAEFKEKVATIDGSIEEAKKYADIKIVDTSELREEISNAEKMKSFISECRSMNNMVEDCKLLKAEAEALTEKINIARTLPGVVLETATIPVEGLTVRDGIPLINDLPISNLSGGEKIKLCVDIALSKPKNLQIILLDGIEALDEDCRNVLYEQCKSKGLQVIASRTTNDSEFTIIEL